MRKVLFRGRTVEHGAWVLGSLVQHDNKPYIFVTDELNKGLDIGGWVNGCRMFEVDPETVGQWTGLTDKNGIKIFEGDICRLLINVPVDIHVSFENGAFGYQYADEEVADILGWRWHAFYNEDREEVVEPMEIEFLRRSSDE